ncbi:MAG: 5-formyltetrahydrofolate cyclo-ligase [Sphingomonadales bacterium]|jgi:5-formyltetrahydrofolate cyclo-ligase
MDKNGLRRLAKQQRSLAKQKLSQIQLKSYSETFIAFLQTQEEEQIIAGYWPMNDEFDCRDILFTAERCGYYLALPAVVGPGLPLVFRHFEMEMRLVTGPFNVKQPPANQEEVIPTVILCPLLAFDSKGARLGYGGGYYDRTLEYLRKSQDCLAIGLAFAAQEVEDIPTGPHDMLLEGVITENGFRKFGA